MNLFDKLHPKAMDKLPFNRRFLLVDATRRLVFVPNYMHKYNQVLTYANIPNANEKSSVDNNYFYQKQAQVNMTQHNCLKCLTYSINFTFILKPIKIDNNT